MVNLTLSEATLNAARAALELRVKHLEHEVAYYERWAFTGEDAQRALIWNIDALLETQTAIEDLSEVRIADHPADATWQGWTEGELVAAFGR